MPKIEGLEKSQEEEKGLKRRWGTGVKIVGLTKKVPKPKRPWLAALLNAWPFPPGLGYLYLDYKWGFPGVWLLAMGMLSLLDFMGLRFLWGWCIAAVCLCTVVHAYYAARRINARLRADLEQAELTV